jgi:hypothetical protein
MSVTQNKLNNPNKTSEILHLLARLFGPASGSRSSFASARPFPHQCSARLDRILVHDVIQPSLVGARAELAQGLGLDLADALAGDLFGVVGWCVLFCGGGLSS